MYQITTDVLCIDSHPNYVSIEERNNSCSRYEKIDSIFDACIATHMWISFSPAPLLIFTFIALLFFHIIQSVYGLSPWHQKHHLKLERKFRFSSIYIFYTYFFPSFYSAGPVPSAGVRNSNFHVYFT